MNRNSFTRTAAALSLGLAALAASPLAQAALVNVDFTVTTDNAVGAFGDTFNGHFSYDDATLNPGGGFGGEDVYSLQSFSFTFAGQAYSLADVPGAQVAYEPGTSNLLGLDAVELNAVFSMLPGIVGGPPASFNYDLGQDGFGFGRIAYVVDTGGNVPEPASLGLLAAALVAAGATRRRAAAR